VDKEGYKTEKSSEMNIKTDKTILSKSPEDTHALARELLGDMGPGTVLALHGELGAGKTCFIQGLAKALGINRPVGSPTFTLINEYPCHPPLYHIDLYRISGPDEALGLGIDEYLAGDGITAIEWAERILELLPEKTMHIHMEPGENEEERLISIRREAGK